MKRHNKRYDRHNRTSRSARKRRPSASPSTSIPETADALFSLPQRKREQWEQITRLVSRMRDEGVSLRRAARDARVPPGTVIQLAGSALRKQRNGRYVAATRDRLLRVLVLPEVRGFREIAVTDSREATTLSHYFTALRRYLHTGDAADLRTFRGTRITLANGARIRLLTDRAAVDRLAGAGVLSFESIYARTA